MAVTRVYIPFKDFSYDAGAFANDKLIVARGVVPWHDTYVLAPGRTSSSIQASTGSQTRPVGVGSFRLQYADRTFVAFTDGSDTYIFEDNLSTITDLTKAAGYAATPSGDFVTFTQFGLSVVATLGHNDPVQYLKFDPSAVAFDPTFIDMITSTFAPRAFFAAPIRGNLFLANLYLGSGYDTLAAGTHPATLAWSQTDNIRAFGSPTVDPQLVGAGYLPILNDGGDITGLVGGDYGIVFQERAIVRVDGPPYSAATITRETGCLSPLSVFRYRGDIYFWSTSGPAVLRNGTDYEPLLRGSLSRGLTEFGTQPFDEWPQDYYVPGGIVTPHGFVDRTTGLVGWAYFSLNSSGAANPSWQILVFNPEEQRCALLPFSAYSLDGLEVSYDSLLMLCDNRLISTGGYPLENARAYFCINGGGANPQRTVWSRGTALSHVGRLYSSFIRLKEDATTRVSRIRPVYRGANLPGTYTPTAHPPFYVQVSTVQNPAAGAYDSAWSKTHDGNGWLTVPGSVHGDYHSIRVRMSTGATPPTDTGYAATTIREFDGVEVEYESGGKYTR